MSGWRRFAEKSRKAAKVNARVIVRSVVPGSTRTISPLLKVTMQEFIRRRLAEGTDEARIEAARAYPGHPLLSQATR